MSNNPEYLTPDLLGSTYLYSDPSSSDTVFTYVVGLTMAVDTGMLQQAIDGLMPRFPHLAVRVEKNGDSLVFGRMTGKVTVCHADDRIAASAGAGFGRESMLSVSVNHKTIYFDIHKSVADEKGVVPFIRAVIYRYLVLGGYDVDNDGSVITSDSSFHSIEADDAFVALDDIPASRPVWYMDARALGISSRSGDSPFKVTRIHIPVAKIKGEAKEYITMPSTIVSPFFAEALLESHPDKSVPGEYVISYIQINLRQYFPTTTLRPFFVDLPLAYNRKLSEYPVGTVLMSQKKLLEAQLRTDALAYNAQRKISLIDRIMETGTVEDKASSVKKMFSDISAEATFSSCNIGSVIFPETMLQYITEFYPVIGTSLFPYALSTINFKGDLVVTVSSADPQDDACRRFVSLLKGCGMPAYISESYIHRPLSYKPQL